MVGALGFSRPGNIIGVQEESGFSIGVDFREGLERLKSDARQSIEGASRAGSQALSGFAQSSGAIGELASSVIDIASGTAEIAAGRGIEREGKRIRDIIATRAREEFSQRGLLARRILASQRAQFAAAGVSGGTVSAVQEFTSAQRALERRLILSDALETANRIAREARRRGKRSRFSGAVKTVRGAVGSTLTVLGGAF